jgi:hypothetical protein
MSYRAESVGPFAAASPAARHSDIWHTGGLFEDLTPCVLGPDKEVPLMVQELNAGRIKGMRSIFAGGIVRGGKGECGFAGAIVPQPGAAGLTPLSGCGSQFGVPPLGGSTVRTAFEVPSSGDPFGVLRLRDTEPAAPEASQSRLKADSCLRRKVTPAQAGAERTKPQAHAT